MPTDRIHHLDTTAKSGGTYRNLCSTVFCFAIALLLFVAPPVIHAADADKLANDVKDDSQLPIAPAVSTGTGLLLEPALTLPEFTREKWVPARSSFGVLLMFVNMSPDLDGLSTNGGASRASATTRSVRECAAMTAEVRRSIVLAVAGLLGGFAMVVALFGTGELLKRNAAVNPSAETPATPGEP